ncbi:MAG TPA: choice-of-anchor P family protein [Acidimicrobiales bacterium]|nr:choice-of-anchor P family protein [Acidimicrobiales bacterium]
MVLLVLAAVPAIGQTEDEPDGYDFFGVSGLADGITTRVVVERFLAVEEFVALSSVSAEARLELGRSSALAVLPDPGDLVLGLPGTLAALAGVAGLPDYPAVARADYPTTPTDAVTLAPDAGLGALRLQTQAEEHRAHGLAFVSDFVDTVGLVPLTVGSIKSDSVARRLDPLTYESTAKSTVNDIRVLGGILRIGQVTSTVTTRVDDGKITATRDETKVTGAEIAGMPVGIDEKGFTSPNGSQALAPIVESLAAPLTAAGVVVRMTPGETVIGATKGTATSGFLNIQFTTTLENAYPVVVTLSFGKASSTVEASGKSSSLLDDLLGGPIDASVAGSALDATGSALGAGTTPDISGSGTASLGGLGGSGGLVTPRPSIASSLEPMDFRSFYRWLALALAGAIVARWVVVNRLRERDTATHPNLRSLWRW